LLGSLSLPFQNPGPGRLVTTVRVPALIGVNAASPFCVVAAPAAEVVALDDPLLSLPQAARPATSALPSRTAPNFRARTTSVSFSGCVTADTPVARVLPGGHHGVAVRF
jgi:hypothetical protein